MRFFPPSPSYVSVKLFQQSIVTFSQPSIDLSSLLHQRKQFRLNRVRWKRRFRFCVFLCPCPCLHECVFDLLRYLYSSRGYGVYKIKTNTPTVCMFASTKCAKRNLNDCYRSSFGETCINEGESTVTGTCEPGRSFSSLRCPPRSLC